MGQAAVYDAFRNGLGEIRFFGGAFYVEFFFAFDNVGGNDSRLYGVVFRYRGFFLVAFADEYVYVFLVVNPYLIEKPDSGGQKIIDSYYLLPIGYNLAIHYERHFFLADKIHFRRRFKGFGFCFQVFR